MRYCIMKQILLSGIFLLILSFSAIAQELLLDKATLSKLNGIQYKKSDSLSLKTDRNIKDIPVSVFSLDKSIYELQGLTNLQELTGSVSSLQHAGWDYGVGDQLEIRGLSVAYSNNSLSNNDFGSTSPNGFSPIRSLTNADSVQVVKGANSSLYGVGSVGGMLNITTKTPLNSKYNSVKLTLGSFKTYGVLVDYAQKNTNNISSRFITNIYNSQGWRKVQDQKIEFFPSVAVIKGESQLVVMGEVSKHKNHFDSIGHPIRLYQNKGSNLPAFGTINAGTGYNINGAYSSSGRSSLSNAHKKEVEDTITKNTGFRVFDSGDAVFTGGILRPAKTNNLGASFKYSNNVNGWNVTQYGQVKKTKQNYVRFSGAYNYVNYGNNANPRGPLVKDGQVYPYALRRSEYRRRDFKENSIDYSIDLNKKFNVNGKKHDVLFVAGYKNQSLNVKEASVYDNDNNTLNSNPAPYILDIRKPILPSKDFEEYTVFKKGEYRKQNITYFTGINDVVELSDKLIVRGGISWVKYLQKRYNYRCYDNNSRAYTSNCSTTSGNDTGRNINIGAIYKIEPKLNLFFGYANGTTPHKVTDNVKTSADVIRGAENIEFGVKHTLPNDGLLTFTVFDTSKTNQAYNYNTGKKDTSGDDIYITLYDANKFTFGYEVDLAYKPSDNSFVSATYANTSSMTNTGSSGKIISKETTGIAEHTFNLFGSYTLLGKINPLREHGQLTVFGNIKYVGKRDLPDSWLASKLDAEKVYLKPYSVVNVGAKLDMYNNWSAVFKINNLQNIRYYERRLFSGGLPGANRNFMLILERKF